MGQDAPPNTDADEIRISDLEGRLRAEAKKLALVQDIGQALSSSLPLEALLRLIMEKVTLLMDADRSTLYLLSDDGEVLWSQIVQGGEAKEIRLRVGEGIAGWVAESGETVNIPDAYSDARFQPSVDLRTGYRTRSILCMPMWNHRQQIIGVIQVLNKEGGPFTEEDEALLAALVSQAAISIENSKLYHSVVRKNKALLEAQKKLERRGFELNALFEIEKDINASHDLDTMLEWIGRRVMEYVGARSSLIALANRPSGPPRVQAAAGQYRDHFRGRILDFNLRDADGSFTAGGECHDDPRWADAFSGLPEIPRHVLCVPLWSSEGVLGLMALIDTDETADASAPGFSEDDRRLLRLIAGQTSRAVQLWWAKSERENENRLASIGQMLASVLHDLKTPMTIISWYAELMAEIDDAEKRSAYVDLVQRQFNLMKGMTREVLAFARGETSVLVRKVYLPRFFDELIVQLQHEMDYRDIEVVLEADYLGVAYFDEQKILRVIHNLARNAAQAMEQGGSFVIRCWVDDGLLHFEFKDNGPGIPAEVEGRIFELFTTAGKKDGTGLGLAIVKKIVDEHEGTISYESTPGKGTSFRIDLPRRHTEEGELAGTG